MCVCVHIYIYIYVEYVQPDHSVQIFSGPNACAAPLVVGCCVYKSYDFLTWSNKYISI